MKHNLEKSEENSTVVASTVYSDNEIDLIDLARVLIRRKKQIFSVLILFVLLGGLFTFFKPASYQYNSLITSGYNEKGNPLISPESSTVLLKKVIASSTWADQEIKAVVLNKTALVQISSLGKKEAENTIKNKHRILLESLTKELLPRIEKTKYRLNQKLENINHRLTLITKKEQEIGKQTLVESLILLEGNTIIKLRLEERKLQLLDGLAKLAPPTMWGSTTRSLEPHGLNGIALFGIFVALGLFFGVFSAVISEVYKKSIISVVNPPTINGSSK